MATALTRCCPGNGPKIIWKFIGTGHSWSSNRMRTAMMTHHHHRHGTVFPKIYLRALGMSIISGGEFGSWGKTPFTCHLLRLNAFYMQIYPGQLVRMRRYWHRKFPFTIFNEPSMLYAYFFKNMIDAILGMLRLRLWNLNIYDQRSCIYGAEIFMILLHEIIYLSLLFGGYLSSETCFLRLTKFIKLLSFKGRHYATEEYANVVFI